LIPLKIVRNVAMSCYNCTKEFSFLNRERGCANCGFGFCSRCLNTKILVPKIGQVKPVCNACHDLIQNPEKLRSYAPPEALQKRLEGLEAPGKTPITVYRQNSKIANLRRGLSQDDQAIVDRLEKLKKERKEKEQATTDSEVAERLAKLKGVKAVEDDDKPFYKAPDTRTEAEKTKDLLEAANEEIQLDMKNKTLSPEDDISARLAKLRGQEAPVPSSERNKLPDPLSVLGQNENLENLDDMEMDDVAKLLDAVNKDVELEAKAALMNLNKDKEIREHLEKIRGKESQAVASEEREGAFDEEFNDEEAADSVLKQILAEQALEFRIAGVEVTGEDTAKDDDDDDKDEELPWCAICNEDATIRCQGCGGDLYCNGCYKEFHIGEDPQEHKPQKFVKKTKNT